MPPRAPLCLSLLAAASLLPSCAYMQTHKNVKELGRTYYGHQLTKPDTLYRSGNTWYVLAAPAEYGLHYDCVHDNVFRKTNEPSMKLRTLQQGIAFHPVSNNTATILLRSDGYVDNTFLASELAQSPQAWCKDLPSMTGVPIKAHIAGPAHAPITSQPTPEDPYFVYRALSGVDFLLVDVPGTVVYNVAVPFIAPFVFFYEFLSGDDE